MKTKFSIAAILLFFSVYVNAQLDIVTNTRVHLEFNTDTSDWDIIDNQEETHTFGLEKSMKNFTQTTNGVKINYVITNWDYDEEKVVFNMTLVDNNQKVYDSMIDGTNLDMYLAYTDENGIEHMDYYVIQDIVERQ